jgi:vancomycin resistance protein YoaR
MAGYSLWYSSRVYPGVEVMGTQLGGMSRQEAVATIEARAKSDLDRPVSFQLGAETAQVSARELGMEFDVAGTVDRAFGVGRSGNWLEKWSDRLGVVGGGHELAPVVQLREQSATEVLRSLASRVDRPVIDAELTLSKDGPALRRSQVGLQLDLPATLGKLPASLEALYAQEKPVQPVILSTPPQVTDAQLEESYKQLSAAWSRPLAASFQGRTWTLPAEDVRPMLRLTGSGAEVRPAVRVDPLKRWVRGVAEDIDRGPRSARIKVATGSVTLVPDRYGHKTNVARTVALLREDAFAGDGRVDAAVKIITPAITNAELKPAVEEADSMVRRPLRLTLGDRTWTLSKSRLTELLAWRGKGEERRAYIPPAELRKWVQQAADDVYRAPVDARIRVVGHEARVAPDRAGVRVLVPETLSSVESALREPSGLVAVSTVTLPADVSAAELQGAAARATRLIGAPVKLTLDGQQWTATTSTLRDWLRWEGEGAQVAPYLDRDSIAAFVESIAEDVNTDVRNAYVSSTAIPQLVEAVEGVEVNERATAAVVAKLARAEQRNGQVVVERTEPTVHASDLRPEYKLIRSWIDGRLYLRMGESRTWWLDPEDISDVVYWNDAGGADIKPYISLGDLEDEIRQWVASPPGTAINYYATAQDALAALKSGDRSVDITYVHVSQSGSTHTGYESYWGGNFPSRWIDINLRSQTLAAYEGGQQVKVTLITSGRPELPTPTGVYSIMRKDSPHKFVSPWPKTSKWWYPTATANFAMLFRNSGYYIHDAPWRGTYGPGTNGSGTPGAAYTGSHGCVNVPYDMMAWLWSWAGTGTPVVIHY